MDVSRLFLSWGMLVLSVVFNASGVFLIKSQLNALGEIQLSSFQMVFHYIIEFLKSPVTCVGLVMFGLAPFFFAVAISRMEISIAYPAQVGLNFVIIVALGFLFLGEPLTMQKFIGIGLVLGSLYFLTG